MQPHNFFSTDATPWHPNSPPRPGEAPHPAPSARKSATRTAQKTALCAPCEHPGGFGIRGSRSRPPLRRPRPLRFERLRVPVWNPYSRGHRKTTRLNYRHGDEANADFYLKKILSTDAAGGTPTRRHALGRLPTPPPLPENLLLRLHKNCPLRPCEHNLQAPLFSRTWSARTRPEPTQGSWGGLISGSICESISGAAPSSLLPTGQENILAMTDSR